jgi:hypothetical protein
MSGTYTSNFAARSDAAMFDHFGGSSATITTTAGNIVLFVAPGDRTWAALQPLTQFGFVVTTGK